MTSQPLPPEPAAATLTTAPPAREERSGRWIEWLAKLGPLIGLIAVFLFFSSQVGPNFYKPGNIDLILQQTVIVGITALGMTMVIVSGGIDLSVGSTIALVTVVIAILVNQGYSGVTAAAGGIVVGGLAGLLIGVLITSLRLAPFIISLGAWGAYRGVARRIADDQVVNVNDVPVWMTYLLRVHPDYKWMIVPAGVYVMLVLAVLMILVMRYTRFGRHVFAIGSNENTARLCGVHVNRTKLLIYTFSGLLTGIAGVMSFGYLGGQGDPTGNAGAELDVIAAVSSAGPASAAGKAPSSARSSARSSSPPSPTAARKWAGRNSVQLIATGGIIVIAAAMDRLRHRRA